jgi:hypothetical protein
VKEPKIKAQFNPLHLNGLVEEDNLDEFLDVWIEPDEVACGKKRKLN